MHRFAGIQEGMLAAVALRLALAEKPQRCRFGGRIAPAPVLEPRGRAGVLDERINIASALEVDRPVPVLRGALDESIDRFLVADHVLLGCVPRLTPAVRTRGAPGYIALGHGFAFVQEAEDGELAFGLLLGGLGHWVTGTRGLRALWGSLPLWRPDVPVERRP